MEKEIQNSQNQVQNIDKYHIIGKYEREQKK